jgi:hypothetical protein
MSASVANAIHRPERPAAKCSTSHRENDFACQPFRAPFKAKVALLLVSNHPFHHASAEALTRRLDHRTTLLGPGEDKPVIWSSKGALSGQTVVCGSGIGE